MITSSSKRKRANTIEEDEMDIEYYELRLAEDVEDYLDIVGSSALVDTGIIGMSIEGDGPAIGIVIEGTSHDNLADELELIDSALNYTNLEWEYGLSREFNEFGLIQDVHFPIAHR